MEKEELTALIAFQINTLSRLAVEIGKTFGTEDIHKFRVNIKKLRALLRLLAWHNGNKDFKLNKKTKTLYLNAGIIRDAGIELNFLSENGLKIVGYERELNNNIIEAKINWEKENPEEAILKLKQKLDVLLMHSISCQDVECYFDRLKGKAATHFKRANTHDDDIHNIRKRLKDVVYIATFTEGAFKNIDKINSEVKTPAKKLEKTIGEYNDLRLLTANLSRYVTAGINSNEVVNRFIQRSTEKLELTKSKIIASIKTYILQC